MNYEPISIDYYADLGSQNSAEYTIEKREGSFFSTIYSGKAYRRPGQDHILIRINEVCENYLSPLEFPQNGGENYHPLSQFRVVSQGEILEEVTFFPDYDKNAVSERGEWSEPINGRVDVRQFCLRTLFGYDEIIVENEGQGGVLQIGPENLVTIRINDIAEGRLLVGDYEYEVVNSGAKYVLYYINAFGGWDSFLIEGNHKESDNLTRHTRSIEYDNTTPYDRGRDNFVNEITKKLTLHTSWLTDDQSKRMHHLLNATQVYLYDLEEYVLAPVLLTNTTTEYKTYKSNGGKLVNYDIEVEFANERVRK